MKREIGKILVVVFVTIIVMVSTVNALNDYIEPLQVNISTKNVEQGGNFTISGTIQPTRNLEIEGRPITIQLSKSLNIVIIPPKGYNGTNINGTMGNIYSTVVSVSKTDYTFTKEISVGSNVDTGNYLVMVLSPGGDWGEGCIYDGLTGNVGTNNFWRELNNQYNLVDKTQAQICSIILNATVQGYAGDDAGWVGYIKVAPAVTPIPIPTSTPTPSPTPSSIPSPSVIPTPSPTPTPIITPTPSPTTPPPTPTPPTPGFGAIFTIAVILGFAVLLMKRKG